MVIEKVQYYLETRITLRVNKESRSCNNLRSRSRVLAKAIEFETSLEEYNNLRASRVLAKAIEVETSLEE